MDMDNKVKQAIKIFDYIHSVDSIRLAQKIYGEQLNLKKEVKIDVFQPKNKFEGISDEVKICIFDYNFLIF